LTHKRDALLSFGFETERRLNKQFMELQRRTSELEQAHRILSSRKLQVFAGLALLVFLQFVVLGRTISEFLTPDGIFYVARPIESVAGLATLLTSLDDTQNYRPLTYLIATPLTWVAGLNPLPYHVFVFIGHIVVTLLVFLLARELMKSARAALVSAAFFGLHVTASHVTFDVAFLPDIAYGSMYALGLFAWLRAGPLPSGEGGRMPGEEASGSTAWRAVSIAAFILSLLSKESAVTFPASVTLMVLLFSKDAESGAGISTRLKGALRQTRVLWAIAIVYLAGYGLLTAGSFFPSDSNHPYRISLTADDLWSRHRYAEWAVNLHPAYDTMAGHPSIVALANRVLPESLAERFPRMSNFYLYLVGPLWMLWLLAKGEWSLFAQFLPLSIETPLRVLSLAALVYFLFRVGLRREARTLFGLGLFVLPLLPVLVLPADKTMVHNLYVPAVGVSLIVGNYALIQWRRQIRRSRLLAVTVPAVLVLMGIHGIRREQDEGWPTTRARTMKTYLQDVMQLYPTLPEGAVFLFEKTGNPDFEFLNGRGDVYRVFYGRPDLATVFEDSGQDALSFGPNQTLIRLTKVGEHLASSP
jgi:hypothetical protein